MEQHLRAALAECDAQLASLAAQQQRLTDQRGLILRALESSVPAAPPGATYRVKVPPPMVEAPTAREPISDVEASILKAIGTFTKKGQSASCRDLEQALGRDYAKFRLALRGLVNRGRIVATGQTNSRRFSLPSQDAAPASDAEGD